MKSAILFFVAFIIPHTLLAQENTSNVEPQETINAWLNGTSDAYKIDNGDDELTRLKKQRVNVLLAELEIRARRHTYSGAEPFLFFVDVHKRLRDAESDLLEKPDQIRDALKRSITLAKDLENRARINWEAGKIPSEDLAHVIYFRIDCEIAYAEAKKEHKWPDDQ